MLRKATAQEAPLLSPEISGLNSSSHQVFGDLLADESFVEMRFTASCEGTLGTAKIYNDGSFTFHSHTEPSSQLVLLHHCCSKSQNLDLEVPGQDVVGATLNREIGLQIWYCSSSCQNKPKPTRQLQSSRILHTGSGEEAKQCQECIQRLASWCKQPFPRRLIVIINPMSGQGRSRQMFDSHSIQTIFKAAGLSVTVRETQRAGHATEIVRSLQLDQCDALVTVGGDGTVFEALQGLLGRPDWQQAAQLPFAMLPTGSGNALSANTEALPASVCMLHLLGMWDLVTAAHAICKGRTKPIDIVSMLQPPATRFYSFLSLNFGLVSNLDIGTEHLRHARTVEQDRSCRCFWMLLGCCSAAPLCLFASTVELYKYQALCCLGRGLVCRWMGNVRFTVGAVQQIMQGKTHHARIAVLPRDHAEAAVQQSGAMPDDENDGHEATQGGQFQYPAGPPLPLLGSLLAQTASAAWPTQFPNGWEEVDGRALQVCAACNLAWLDTSFQLAPEANLESGCLDLIYTTGTSGRVEGLRMMTKVETGSHLGMSLVHSRKVSAMILEPVSTGTWLVLDGEAIPYKRIYAEVHKSLCRVIVA